jgi:hypothetical protein
MARGSLRFLPAPRTSAALAVVVLVLSLLSGCPSVSEFVGAPDAPLPPPDVVQSDGQRGGDAAAPADVPTPVDVPDSDSGEVPVAPLVWTALVPALFDSVVLTHPGLNLQLRPLPAHAGTPVGTGPGALRLGPLWPPASDSGE